MKILKLSILFLIINFSALAIGSWLMNNGPISEWYVQLNKAPWTPDGWVFGVAWTTIMICFSIYLAYVFKDNNSTSLKILFALQVFLNIIWNYAFFNQHQIGLGLLIIFLLTIVVFYFFFKFNIKTIKYLLLPYMVWLCLATSLNAYIYLYN
jgi:benzodiazapine receptor